MKIHASIKTGRHSLQAEVLSIALLEFGVVEQVVQFGASLHLLQKVP
jgi:hypothetical protein